MEDSYISKLRAAGFTWIFIRPIGPSYANGNFSTVTRTAVNDYILATYPRYSLDPAIEPRIFAKGANNDTNWYNDISHPNAAGAGLEAAALASKMMADGLLDFPAEVSARLVPSLTINAAIGVTYKIEATATLESPSWSTVETVTLTQSPQVWIDPAGITRFYRVTQAAP